MSVTATYKIFDNNDGTFNLCLQIEDVIIPQYSVTLEPFPMSVYLKGITASCAEQKLDISAHDEDTRKNALKIVQIIFKQMGNSLEQFLAEEGYV